MWAGGTHRDGVGSRGGVSGGKDKGRLRSSRVEAFSWETQPALSSQQLCEPLEMGHLKEKGISGMFSGALPRAGAVVGTEGSSSGSKQTEHRGFVNSPGFPCTRGRHVENLGCLN